MSDDLSIKVWSILDNDVKNIKCVSSFDNCHIRPIYSCTFNEDGNIFATVFFISFLF